MEQDTEGVGRERPSPFLTPLPSPQKARAPTSTSSTGIGTNSNIPQKQQQKLSPIPLPCCCRRRYRAAGDNTKMPMLMLPRGRRARVCVSVSKCVCVARFTSWGARRRASCPPSRAVFFCVGVGGDVSVSLTVQLGIKRSQAAGKGVPSAGHTRERRAVHGWMDRQMDGPCCPSGR